MMEAKIEPAMLAKLEKLVEQYRDDTSAVQEALCVKLGQDNPEIGAKGRELFAKQRLALQQAKLNDLSERFSKVKPKIEALKAKAQKAEVTSADSAKGWERENRRSWGEEEKRPAASSEELVKKVLQKAEASFKNSAVQPTRAIPEPSPKRRSWDEVQIPERASEIEALTYVPGLVGDIVEWIVAGARRPNRVMALGVALGVVGTLIGRRVEGPTGSATHLYIFILAPTGWGKDWPLWCGNKLMIAVGAKELLGPSEFVSGRGIIKFLKRNPVTLCFVDELGDVFQLINGQQDNPWITDLIGHFKKLYNSWQIIITAESMKDKSVTINHPAVTIVGACTPQSLFEAMKPKDVESGFANRPMLLPFEGFKRPPERDAADGMEEPPKELIAQLMRLRPAKSLLDKPFNESDDPAPPVLPSDREKIVWEDDKAKAAYFAFSAEMDQWENKNRRKFELGMRATENAIRCATNVAAGCFSPSVDHRDMEWALKWSRVSFNAATGGFETYMKEYFEFPKFCEEVAQSIHSAGGFMPNRDLERRYRKHMKRGDELNKALLQLQKEDRIKKSERRNGERGPAAAGWKTVEEE